MAGTEHGGIAHRGEGIDKSLAPGGHLELIAHGGDAKIARRQGYSCVKAVLRGVVNAVGGAQGIATEPVEVDDAVVVGHGACGQRGYGRGSVGNLAGIFTIGKDAALAHEQTEAALTIEGHEGIEQIAAQAVNGYADHHSRQAQSGVGIECQQRQYNERIGKRGEVLMAFRLPGGGGCFPLILEPYKDIGKAAQQEGNEHQHGHKTYILADGGQRQQEHSQHHQRHGVVVPIATGTPALDLPIEAHQGQRIEHPYQAVAVNGGVGREEIEETDDDACQALHHEQHGVNRPEYAAFTPFPHAQ